MQETNDTIAAIATPPGRGGIGIVRVSGPAAKRIATALLGQCPPPRRADYLPFHDGEDAILDEGIAIFFAGPHSFTGEDILELHGHGGAVIMDMLLAAVVHQGARLARPGEFSERAFLNAKLDLAQAEAIADLIDASTTQAARGALRSLRGEFSSHIYNMVEQLTELRIYVESMIDFPEEEIDTLTDGAIATKLATVMEQLAEVQQKARQGSLLREGMTIVIAGQPNVGKSSLLNALAGHESAIVTAIPGTTRDILREHITIDGLPLHVIDTAGLRNAKDVVEQEGIRRAWNEITQADGILLVIDDTLGIQQEEHEIMARLPKGVPITIVHNKIDLSGTAVGECPGEWGHHPLPVGKEWYRP